MKHSLIKIFLLILVTVSSVAAGQSNAVITIHMKVYGNCSMCKERIEKAAKGKGVKEASWDADTKFLTITYDTLQTRIEKVHSRIADAGHDTELKKAKDDTYSALPECCLYRDKSTATDPALHMLQQIRGVVLEEDGKGNFRPLPGATIHWSGTNTGTVADSSGTFKINTIANADRLVVSYAGYSPDTLSAQPTEELKIILGSDQQLGEVTLTSRLRSTYLSSLSTIRTQVMTERELFKAACCNLSESFETNPSVDVSYNDAVTGSKQIQLLGLSGNYTQLTVENLPGPRGLATTLGLNSIPGPWVESIQLNKGVGSVANGYESIAGQINIELKKPEKAEQFYANGYLNDMGKSDLNLNLAHKLGKKWSTALLLHDDFIYNKVDFNKDGFRDLPTGNLFTAMNRWKFEDGKGFIAQFGAKLLTDERTGGETAFDPGKDKFTTNHYGLGIRTRRFEVFSKTGYVFPGKKYKSIGLQLMAFSHDQDSYFGLNGYKALQKSIYANLIYQSIIGNSNHKFRTGLSWTGDRYDETIRAAVYKRSELVPGGFFEYTFTPSAKLGIVAGIRGDHNNLYGWFVTPRLHLRYEPVKGTTFRLSAGRGQRTANIFAENTSVLVSSRQISILSAMAGKAYGLDPEIAWNKGISLDQQFRLFSHAASFSIDFFRNDFSNQVVVDLEDIHAVKFYNLQGKSFSNSLQAELHLEPARKLELRLAYRYFDVQNNYSGQQLQKPFTSKNRAFANLAYELKGWKFDYTVNLNGPKRIPSTAGNPVIYQKAPRSPSYWLMNAQISKTVFEKHPVDIYLGGENLTNYFQQDVILATDQPFSPWFDASLVWGPVSGRLVYLGFRYKIK
jgi:outer membrane receptor for ferrienterochelin and colicin/copper chaperone CopZ